MPTGSTVDLLYHSARIRMEVKKVSGALDISTLEKSDFFAPHRGNILVVMPLPEVKKILVTDNRRSKNAGRQDDATI